MAAGSQKKKGVLLLPKDVQFMGPNRPPRARSPRFAKLYSRVALGWSLFWQGFISPLYSAPALFRFICQALILFLVFSLLGEKKMIEHFTSTAVGAIALVSALLVWALIQAVATPFRVT